MKVGWENSLSTTRSDSRLGVEFSGRARSAQVPWFDDQQTLTKAKPSEFEGDSAVSSRWFSEPPRCIFAPQWKRAKNLKSVHRGSYGLRWSISSFFPFHWLKPRDMTVASLGQPLPRDNRGEVLEKDNLFGTECKSLEMLKYKAVEWNSVCVVGRGLLLVDGR